MPKSVVINPAFKSSADLAENHEFGQGGTYITVDRAKLATRIQS